MIERQGSAAEPGGGAASTDRPMRADAVRNRERILEAAAEVFAAQGVSVPVDLVAERAGVGVGTLYRHFPRKEDLFAAIVGTKIDDLVHEAQAAAARTPADRALFAFIGQLASEIAIKADLFDALDSAGVDVKSRFAGPVRALKEAVGVLLVRAASSGAIRGDLSGEDVLGLIVGTCHGVRQMGGDPASTERLVAILCDGLRSAATG